MSLPFFDEGDGPDSMTAATNVDIELKALGIAGGGTEAFTMGRASGVQAAQRHGPVPDAVVDALASMIASDPSVRVAG